MEHCGTPILNNNEVHQNIHHDFIRFESRFDLHLSQTCVDDISGPHDLSKILPVSPFPKGSTRFANLDDPNTTVFF